MPHCIDCWKQRNVDQCTQTVGIQNHIDTMTLLTQHYQLHVIICRQESIMLFNLPDILSGNSF